MGIIKTAILVGGGIYAAKTIMKKQDKKERTSNNNLNPNMPASRYPPGPPPAYYQNQSYQQEGPGYYNYNTQSGPQTRENGGFVDNNPNGGWNLDYKGCDGSSQGKTNGVDNIRR
ncbi:hypothetical protein BGW36DRAFT_377286 [Talaromyces proteolyticus]|uniref:Uncharacterized protein n=1 Tax=Talaromyces proteolyticus TaxID=1131652 RepID=A0AAD4KUL0_9EURO|nr:uncharacterized protein BGW36DRAFT_377286 [Talaromyces proteolyticus]KAH8699100.1 hypothetical protein BGW36DRAFT_377286 [Talaromyces proteolyticus]